MFPKKHQPVVQAFLMSVVMVTIMTAVITTLNTGIDRGFPGRWGTAILVAWPIAFMVILIAGKPVMRLSVALSQRD